MEKEFVPYEQALALKQLGFDKPCFKAYTEAYKTLINLTSNCTNTSIENTLPTKPITAPLYQQAFKWFREEYSICSWIYQVEDNRYFFSLLKNGRYLVTHSSEYKIYKEAELECLKKLIEIVKNDN